MSLQHNDEHKQVWHSTLHSNRAKPIPHGSSVAFHAFHHLKAAHKACGDHVCIRTTFMRLSSSCASTCASLLAPEQLAELTVSVGCSADTVIVSMQGLMMCLQRRAVLGQMATPILSATSWGGHCPAYPLSSPLTSKQPAKSRSLSAANWMLRSGGCLVLTEKFLRLRLNSENMSILCQDS